MTTPRPCPCGSQLPAPQCCDPLLRGTAPAATAESLMRSRFCAFQRAQSDYLVSTHHPSRRQPDEQAELQASFAHSHWQSLDVVDRAKGQPGDREGWVEFIAHFIDSSCVPARKGVLQERSYFVREHGQWYYHSGDIVSHGATATLGRNEACWCGSGKKYKHCHLRHG